MVHGIPISQDMVPRVADHRLPGLAEVGELERDEGHVFAFDGVFQGNKGDKVDSAALDDVGAVFCWKWCV